MFSPPAQNQLLALLPADEAERLSATMERLELPSHAMLIRPHVPIAQIYFPLTAVISLLQTFEDGAAVEVATIGNEGMIGSSLLLGVDSIALDAIAQVPGDALAMPVAVFREEVGQDSPLRSIVERYLMALLHQITQSVGCNARHTIVHRCARWLLMTQDRVGRDDFPLTHELLAVMLGVRRPGVTAAAGALQRAGLIDYRRGHITITNRAGLESVACECYAAVREEFERVMRG